MACAIVAGALVAETAFWPETARFFWLIAGVLIPMRLAANMLDGMVAIESGRASRLGELFNEVPDRVSDAAVFIGLGYASGSTPALGYLAALLAVFTAYVRAMGKIAGAPQFYQGPMAKPQRMWLVTLFCLWAVAAPSTLVIETPTIGITPPALALLIVILGTLVTTARRLYLIKSYFEIPCSAAQSVSN